jgi:hypothetical protein
MSGCVIAQAFGSCLLTAQPQVQSQIPSCEIRDEQNGTGAGFPPEIFRFFPAYHHSIIALVPSPLEVCNSPDQGAHYHFFNL